MKESTEKIPETQYAVQLVGPGRIELNRAKPVDRPGPHQILARIEATALCFSDLKLVKQFSEHTRKGEIVQGIDRKTLAEIPSYVPGEKPTVPGHETACRIVAVGEKVRRHKVGERCLVQTDYRSLATRGSVAAFGYNFEGGLQEYVLMDERVVIDPKTDKRYLIGVGEEMSAAAVCLVEPWACVEDSYVTVERRTAKAGGAMLVVAEAGHAVAGLAESFSPDGPPAEVTMVCSEESQRRAVKALGAPTVEKRGVEGLANEAFDDVIYFGARAEGIERLNDKLAAGGIINIVTGGRRIGGRVSVGVGRIHYSMCRWVGTTGESAAESYGSIPASGEIRPGEKILVIGAGGPMGQMHVIRNICSGLGGISVTATDLDPRRVKVLGEKVRTLAAAQGVPVRPLDAPMPRDGEEYSYIVIAAPAPEVTTEAIDRATRGGIVNLFAGVPIGTRQELDLDRYIERGCFLFGTSGSVIRDMEIVLAKVRSGRLDTARSVDAISGMAGVADGIEAIEKRSLAGKIVVYPSCHELGLVALAEMGRRLPNVAAKLDGGQWGKEAERELLATEGDTERPKV